MAVFEDVKLPEGTVLIPGVVGHATDFVEHGELVAERIMKYAALVGRAKFQAMAEGAKLASEQLWR